MSDGFAKLLAAATLAIGLTVAASASAEGMCADHYVGTQSTVTASTPIPTQTVIPLPTPKSGS